MEFSKVSWWHRNRQLVHNELLSMQLDPSKMRAFENDTQLLKQCPVGGHLGRDTAGLGS